DACIHQHERSVIFPRLNGVHLAIKIGSNDRIATSQISHLLRNIGVFLGDHPTNSIIISSYERAVQYGIKSYIHIIIFLFIEYLALKAPITVEDDFVFYSIQNDISMIDIFLTLGAARWIATIRFVTCSEIRQQPRHNFQTIVRATF